MDRRLFPAAILLLALVGAGYLFFDGGAAALVLTLVLLLAGLAIFRHYTDERLFITNIFLSGLAIRLMFGLFVHAFDLRDFFGGDANTYDYFGEQLLRRWMGVGDPSYNYMLDNIGAGWGMFDLVAGIYYLFGRNILAAQSVCAVFGACIAPMVYFCAKQVFQNRSVARSSAYLAAFFPAFIIWSGQLLKDGLIVFLLVLAMTMVLELQRRFSWQALVMLLLSVAGVLPLRFYIFYMLAPAIAGSFIIGASASARAVARNTVILVLMGLALTYLGATRYAGETFEAYGSLARVQNSRTDLVQSAKSGFAGDVDVSTTEGAISTIPIGLTYLLLAPFPWEMTSFRSGITAPEVIVWWAMMPLMVIGIAWTLRNNLRRALPILLFSLMLTLAYSITQGNVGTAYRQRTQIQVFLFMFISVGWTIRREKKENEQILAAAHRRTTRAHIQAVREGALHS